MTRVLLVTTNYWPEPTGISLYTTDLAESLVRKGHSVTVLTSLPHYPWWKIPTEFNYMREGLSSHRGVSLVRARHLVPTHMSALVRMRFEISLWLNLRRVSKQFLVNDFDLVIAYIPTVAAGIIGRRIAQQFGISYGLIVQDLSGAGAKQSGLRGGAVISRIAQFVESKVLHGADNLVVVSPSMKEVLRELGVPEKRITHITNYSAKQISPRAMRSARERFGWSSDNFIIIHTGNMGAKQDLENVVKTANLLLDDLRIKIYLVGHGNQESHLKNLCEGRINIAVLPAVSNEDYSALLASADLLLVNERSTQMDMSLPSKLTSYLYSRRPVLAAVPRGGATWKFLDGIAELVEAEKPLILANAIRELSKNPEKRKELASKGLKFARENLDAEIGREKYLDWVNSLIQSKRG